MAGKYDFVYRDSDGMKKRRMVVVSSQVASARYKAKTKSRSLWDKLKEKFGRS